MSSRIDLVILGEAGALPEWPLGAVRACDPTPSAVHRLIEQEAADAEADFWLFWDAGLGLPAPETVNRASKLPGDVWHAGLRLGLGGLPGLLDFVSPTWMLNADPSPALEATSWRLSLRACLLPLGVLRQLGNVDPGFSTLNGAALEMGHRFVMRGVLVRHVPWLLPDGPPAPPLSLPLEDEVRFMRRRFGPRWSGWALVRAALSGYAPLPALLRAWRGCSGVVRHDPALYGHPSEPPPSIPVGARVSVLIPTLDRYPYLRTLLSQLRQQTVPPHEIIVVDQTPSDRRDVAVSRDYADLPLRILYQDQPGQCTARNAGLNVACGEYVLHLDDDVEIPPNLIEAHLESLHCFQAGVSSGGVDETGAGPPPVDFRHIRVNEGFSGGNSLVRRGVLRRSGLFDLAYDHRQRADGDLGMRLYLGGTLMVHNPQMVVLHHHAPQGGLRTHGARVVTYASSRRSLLHRHLPSDSEIYLAMRYFTPRQVREMLWLRALGTFSIRGGVGRRSLKAVISLALLPHTLWVIHQRVRSARRLLKVFPQIPDLVGTDEGH